MSDWERVSELFEAVMALKPEERDAFLAQQCLGDDVLRTEIESLLKSYGPGSTFFDDLAANVVGPATGGLLDTLEPAPADAVLGHYEIVGSIGVGGMGVVYRARDLKLNRFVALKFIAPELIHDVTARDRLVREARAAAALDDPRIGVIHAIEEAPDGRLFLVMPYYAGETLKQRLARGPLAFEQAVDIATEMAEGLARAHRAGIVHRDIKPANVLITDDGTLKILDFGLAKLTSGAAQTRSGVTAGTAAYMAPEQARGEAADPRSDVWSLGVVLYEMMAGCRPFRGDSEPAIIYALLQGAPEPLRKHAPDIPEALEQLVERMLAKDATQRPANAGAIAEALRQIRTASPAQSDQNHRARREMPAVVSARDNTNARFSRRRRVAFGAGLAVLIALAAFVTSRTNTKPALTSEAIAVLPFVVQGDAELDYLRDGMVHLLSTKLDGVGDLRAVDPHALLASFSSGNVRLDPSTGRAAAARFGAGAFVLGAVLRLGTGIELTASLYGRGGELQVTASAMAKQDSDLAPAVDELVRELVAHRLADAGERLAGLAAMTTHSLPALRAYLEGEHLLRSGRPAAAANSLKRAVELDSTFGLAWYRLARAAGWVGPVELNEEAAARAVRFGGTLPERTRTLVSAYRVFRVSDPVEAERLYRRILARYPDDMETLELLGETLFHNNPFFGRPTAEAREPFEHALAMDPGNRELMVHLMDLAARDGRAQTVDSLATRYVSAEPGTELPTAQAAYAALRELMLEPRPFEREQILARLMTAGPEAIFDALIRVAPQLRDVDLSDRLAALLADPSAPSNLRISGHLHRAWFSVARGRWRAAETHWQAAAVIQPGRTLLQRVLTASLPHSTASPEQLDSLQAAVAKWAGSADVEEQLHEADIEPIRSYMLGLLAWRAGDQSALTRAVRELSATRSARAGSTPARRAGGTPGLASALAATLEALQHWQADRLGEALTALDRGELRIPFHRRARSPLLEQHLNRFVRAEVLRAQETEAADREALRWYASLEDGYFHWGAPFLGPALIATAEIHERNGRIGQAASDYERFLSLWADADPELDAWVALARERLDRIRSY